MRKTKFYQKRSPIANNVKKERRRENGAYARENQFQHSRVSGPKMKE